MLHHGEISTALFMIRTGQAEVVKAHGQDSSVSRGLSETSTTDAEGSSAFERIALLERGTAFGEQSFVSEMPSLATVRSTCYSEIMRLWRDDFEGVVAMFPALRVHMLGVSRQLKHSYKAATARAQYMQLEKAHKSKKKSLFPGSPPNIKKSAGMIS